MNYFDASSSFAQVIGRLRGKTRDPLSTRVSSVTAAIVDVAEGDVTAGKVYASAISTLEGILRQNADDIDADIVLDSLYTQAALLKVLQAVIPHVSPATVQATAATTSRVLRAMVTSTISLLADENSEAILDTNDGLLASNHVLVASCHATAEVLRQLPHQTEDATVRKLLNETLMMMLQDSARPRVQNAAKEELSGLLLMKSPQCHPAIRISTNKYSNVMIDRYLKHPSQHNFNQSMIDLMGFLNPALAALDFTEIGGRIMTILVDLLNLESSSSSSRPVFMAKSRASTLHILTINSILSVILSLLESGEEDGAAAAGDFLNKLDAFAARVLASLVQVKSTVVFREGVSEDDLLESGRLIYGMVMLSASQRLLSSESNAQLGSRLVPLVFQHLFGLSRPIGEDAETNNGETLFLEASQLIRINLQHLKETNVTLHERCSKECLQVFATVVRTPFDPMFATALQPLALLLQQISSSNALVVNTVLTMVKLRSEAEVQDEVRTSVDGALLSLLEGVGVEHFWTCISFNKLLCEREKNATASHKYTWIFDIMKASAAGRKQTLLAFFQNEVLPLACNFDISAAKGGPYGLMYRSIVVNLWSLFPVFCQYPVDLESTLPDLVPTLIKATNDERYTELMLIVCKGLNVLFSGVVQRKDDLEELIESDEAETTRKEIVVLASISSKILPSLFKLVDALHKGNSSTMDDKDTQNTDGLVRNDQGFRIIAVIECISIVARLAPQELVRNLFSKVLQRILQSSQNQDDSSISKMCSLLSLAQAMVVSESLEDSSIELLYRALKPLIRTDETPARVQKRAYKLLCDICKSYHSFIAEAGRLKDITALLSSTGATSQVSARFMRMKCLTIVVEGFDDSKKGSNYQELTSSLVGEILLCLKDSNAKTRDAAYKLLFSTCRLHGDSASFVEMVAAAIGSNTSHMRSAAVTALARLVFEFSSEDERVHEMLPLLLKTVLVLAEDPSREVTKSMVLFVRVSVRTSSQMELEPLLPDILGGLLKYHRGKDRFKSKIKIIIKKLVKMFGYDALLPFVPLSDVRLLTHMRKLDEREARRKKSSRYQQAEETVGFDAMEDSDGEQDSDDGLSLASGMTRKSRFTQVTGRSKRTLSTRPSESRSLVKSIKSSNGRTSIRIKSEADGEVMDVRELKTVTFANEGESEDDCSDAEIEFDASGKLIVHGPDDHSLAEDEFGVGAVASLKRQRATKNIKSTNSGSIRGTKKVGGTKAVTARPGQAYRSKKAGGDIKKKGQKYEPYAYMQLDGRNYSRKNRRQVVEQMGSIVERGRKRQKR